MYASFDFIRRIIPETATAFQQPAFPLAGSDIDMWFEAALYFGVSAATDVLSCSRASIGYAKTLAGTLTQFANDTLRLTSLGLLAEDSRTNIQKRSQEFDNTTEWSVSNVTVTANTTTAPDGTATADSIITTVASGEHKVGTTSGTTTAAQWTASCYFKPNGYNFGAIAINNTTFDSWWVFDLVAGTSTRRDFGAAPTGETIRFEVLANGWVRPSVTIDASANSFILNFGVLDQSTYHTWAGDGVSGIFLWGAQVELGAFPSSYVPTTSTSATRAADVITISGAAQTDIAAATGSIVAWTDNGEGAGFAANIVDSNGTNLLGFDATNHGLASITSTLTTANTATRDTVAAKLGLAWSGSGRSLVLDGGSVATDAVAQTPSSTLHLGSTGTVNFVFTYITRLVLFTSKLADATLQGDTT
jgi:hypothetical protein